MKGVLSEAIQLYFGKTILYSNVLPDQGLNSTQGQLSSIKCAKLCADQKYCQTIFYKPMTNMCSLYKYPLLKYTPTSSEPGIEVYELEGCPHPEFDVSREIGMCLKVYQTTNFTYSYITSVCNQEGGELISLDTDTKIDFLSAYLLMHFGTPVGITVGLDNSAGWKWTNGEPLSISHPNVVNGINNYDMAMDPCESNYCGILSVYSTSDMTLYDNCCNNLASFFVCTMPYQQ
eukprot:XP_011427781.2 PREDICTED: uncharacterized protein LOC105328555 [Crassostrea gigas]